MPKSGTERRLSDVASRLKARRDELAVIEEQLPHLEESAEEAKIQALVSDTGIHDREGIDAERHAQAMRRHRADVVSEIAALEVQQDQLLDRMLAEKARG